MPFGINWKTIGLICGVCAAPFTGGASLAACVACGGAGLVAGHILDKSEKKDKAKQQNLDLKGKTVETIIADNQQAQQENDEWKKKLDELDEKIKKRDKEVKRPQPYSRRKKQNKQSTSNFNRSTRKWHKRKRFYPW